MEEAMTLSFEFVNNCKPGDLLRVKIEDTVVNQRFRTDEVSVTWR